MGWSKARNVVVWRRGGEGGDTEECQRAAERRYIEQGEQITWDNIANIVTYTSGGISSTFYSVFSLLISSLLPLLAHYQWLRNRYIS
jgi:hypothetical protein